MIINRFKYIVIIVFLLILITLINTSKNPSQYDKKTQLVNLSEKAKTVDKEQFINYKVKNQNNSSELIAVIFNTSNNYNIGFIDEYGNVVKEPFLKKSNFDYTNCTDGNISMNHKYVNGYYYELSSNKYYNKNFIEVTLSKEEQKKYKEESYLRNKWEDISLDQSKNFPSHLKDSLHKDFGINEEDVNCQVNGNLYQIDFAVDGRIYTVFYDDEYKIQGNMFFSNGDYNQFEFVDSKANVGAIFIRDLGMVYFNMDGKIIWVTYSRECE